jgi:hypothetical protein
LIAHHAVRNFQELLFGPWRDRRARRTVMAAAESSDGRAGGLHDRREIEALRDEFAGRPGADLDPVIRLGEGDDR